MRVAQSHPDDFRDRALTRALSPRRCARLHGMV